MTNTQTTKRYSKYFPIICFSFINLIYLFFVFFHSVQVSSGTIYDFLSINYHDSRVYCLLECICAFLLITFVQKYYDQRFVKHLLYLQNITVTALIGITGSLFIAFRYTVSGSFLIQFLLHTITNYFLCGIVIIQFTLLCQKLSKKFFATLLWVSMIALLFVAVPYLQLKTENSILNSFLELFEIFPAFQIYAVELIGCPVFIKRIATLLFWTFMLRLILNAGNLSCETFQKSVKNVFRQPSFYLAMITLGIFIISGDNLASASTINSDWEETSNYYAKNPTTPETYEPFHVNRYSFDLWITNKLKSEVSIEINEQDQNLTEYAFTLFHTYKVLSCTNQTGENLEFDQTDDYITIKRNESPMEKIMITYAGNSSLGMSQLEGTFLRSGTAFYPIPGYHSLYDGNLLLQVQTEKIPYNVNIHSPLTYACTLPEVDRNTFRGEDTSFSCLQGSYCTSMLDDTKIIYAGCYYGEKELEYCKDTIRSMNSFLCENKLDETAPATILFVNGTVRFEGISFGNHFVVQGCMQDEEYTHKLKDQLMFSINN